MLTNGHVIWLLEEKWRSYLLCAGRQDFSLSDLTESILLTFWPVMSQAKHVRVQSEHTWAGSSSVM